MSGFNKKTLYLACGGVAAVLIIALILAIALGSCGSGKYDKYFSEAETAFLSGDYDTALDKLSKAVAAEPTEEAYLLMAQIYEQQGNINMAIQVLYLGYSKTGSDEISGRLDELKSGENGTNADVGTVKIGTEEVALDANALVLAECMLEDRDLNALAQLVSLDTLSLSDNNITDISALSTLKGLEFLQLSGNRISDISPLKNLTKLKTLYLDENPITDFTPLYTLTALKTLSMKGVEIGQSQLEELQEALPNCSIYSDEAVEEVVDVTLGGVTFRSDAEELDLSGKNISDISALAVCKKLRRLDLSGNSVGDISALVDMQQLQWLDISENNVTDLSPLLSLTELTYLDVGDNMVTDISVVGYLPKLLSLDVSENELTAGVSAVGKLTALEKLSLKATSLTDEGLRTLKSVTTLRELNIEDNGELTKNAVEELRLSLEGCEVTASELHYTVELGGHIYKSDVTSITELSAGITELDGLENFTELISLVLPNNSVSDISALEGLTQLETLDLYENDVYDLSPLEEHTALKKLDLMNNRVSDISALSSCTALEELQLSYNSLRRISALSSLKKLKRLELEGNKITDISALSSLKSLSYLDLNDNDISDITPLCSLDKLEFLYICGNDLTAEDIQDLKAALPGCTVVSDFDMQAAMNSYSASP